MATRKQVRAAKRMAKKRSIRGRSTMGRWSLIEALRKKG